jgi:hypothetical protein
MTTIGFKLLSGDASGIPAIYYRPTSPHFDSFDVYEVNEWADLDSSAIATHGRYNVQSGTVSLDNRSSVDSALASHGFRWTVGGIIDDSGTVIAAKELDARKVALECLWRYGAKDVAADLSGNNLRKLVKAARNAL